MPNTLYVQDRFTSGTGLTFPNSTDGGSEPGFFGPNFLSAPIPEASTTVSLGLLLVLGAGGLVWTSRRRARRAA